MACRNAGAYEFVTGRPELRPTWRVGCEGEEEGSPKEGVVYCEDCLRGWGLIW